MGKSCSIFQQLSTSCSRWLLMGSGACPWSTKAHDIFYCFVRNMWNRHKGCQGVASLWSNAVFTYFTYHAMQSMHSVNLSNFAYHNDRVYPYMATQYVCQKLPCHIIGDVQSFIKSNAFMTSLCLGNESFHLKDSRSSTLSSPKSISHLWWPPYSCLQNTVC